VADRRGAAEAGFTLIEMLVSMTVFLIVLGVIMSVYVSLLHGLVQTQDRAQNVDQARLAVEEIDRMVRSGNVLYNPANETTPDSLRVYTQANGLEKCMQWKVADNELQVRSWDPDYQQDNIVTSWHVVATHLVTPTTDPFSLDANPAYNDRLLDISLAVSSDSANAPAIHIQTSVEGRNTEFDYPASICASIPPG
jgi:prepilin-type N-terminal cleavage/methylation domain-containing protein